MLAFFYAIHILICVALIVVVLLQTGKGVGLASVFGAGGGGGADTLFGSKGFGGMLAKATGVLAVLFMVSSISLSLIPRGERGRESVLDTLERPSTGVPAEQPGQVPTAPSEGQVPSQTEVPESGPGETPQGD
jgi:preprotein translocase subunit SecG